MTANLLPARASAGTSAGVQAAAGLIADRSTACVERLREIAAAPDGGMVEFHRPGPSAAFSRRDAREPGFDAAVDAVVSHGFEPFIRPVGGRLAAYHEGALVLDILSRSQDPRPGTTARFRVAADAIARGLRRLGVDSRVGEVPGEYCPGEWSVNAGGRYKLVGTGQRLIRGAFLYTAVIVVGDADPLADVMSAAYAHLGLEFDPATVGSVSRFVPGVTLSDVAEAVGEALAADLPLDGPDIASGRRIIEAWDAR
jgi:octanoyl-[GcvH]:protein N-octanoyltransferase